jgi:hypothetical protein
MKSARYEDTNIIVLLPENFPMQNHFLGEFITILTKKSESFRLTSELAIFQIENYPDEKDDKNNLRCEKPVDKTLSQNNINLCCVIGNVFYNTEINRRLTDISDEGVRILVFSNDIEYKHLAEYLRVPNIKHKARIEKIDFNNPDNGDILLLSGIIDDELRRIST